MTKLYIGAGGLVTVSLIAVMYLAGPVSDLPFAPFDWMGAMLPGALGAMRADANLRDCGRYDSAHLGQACLGVMAG